MILSRYLDIATFVFAKMFEHKSSLDLLNFGSELPSIPGKSSVLVINKYFWFVGQNPCPNEARRKLYLFFNKDAELSDHCFDTGRGMNYFPNYLRFDSCHRAFCLSFCSKSMKKQKMSDWKAFKILVLSNSICFLFFSSLYRNPLEQHLRNLSVQTEYTYSSDSPHRRHFRVL